MRNRGTLFTRACARVFAAAFAAVALAGPAAAADPLRVCADPDNLPFTKNEGPERGLYIDLAELVAKVMGVPVEYTWYHTGNERRALRNTILAKACDTVFALPSDYRARGISKTQPFLKVGYAVVAAPDFKFKGLDDLRGKRIAVLFSTTPHIVLNTLEGFTTATYRNTEEAFVGLAKGEVDAAFLWGPSAGYENRKTQGDRWRVTPVTGLDLAGEVSIGVRADMAPLLGAINKALDELQPQIAQLADKYSFPRQAPVLLTAAGAAAKPGQRMVAVSAALVRRVADTAVPAKVSKKKPVAAQAGSSDTPPPVAAKPELSAAAQAGRVRFNDACSHCHGADGYSPVRERDLRRLHSRYDAKWPDMAATTIRNGRSEQGMPAWKDILKETEVQEILGFLATMQK